MKTLLLLRHAKSSWDDPALPDHDRPLNLRGRRDAPTMGHVLAEARLLPELILSSTAVRARSTADTAARAAGCRAEIRYDGALYQAGVSQFAARLSALGEEGPDRVLVVAHNPGLEALVLALSGTAESLPSAALVRIELPIGSWSEFNGSIRGRNVRIWRPKDLR